MKKKIIIIVIAAVVLLVPVYFLFLAGDSSEMTADEKHISKLAGDMKYDKKHHG